MGMTVRERELVLRLLAASEARLLGSVEGLTAEQWGLREGVGRWSIAEVIEHCIVFEEFIRGRIVETLEGAAEPEKMAGAAAKEGLVMRLAESRGTKFVAREVTRPVGRWMDTEEMVAELRKTRARTLAFVEGVQGDLRGHFFPHIAFGDLDCYQWLVVLGQHSMRHVLQIEEIKAAAGYPA
jgi:DinB superfamily